MPDHINKTGESGTVDFPVSIIEARDATLKTATSEEANNAMLLMLEDLNEMMTSIEASKKEWESTVDSISDPLFIHDRELKIVRCNKAYRELAGSPNFKEIIGKPYFEVFPKIEAPFKMCMKSIEEEGEEEILVPALNKIFKVRYYPIRNTDNSLLYSVHIMEDITEAKRATDAIRESEERFRAVTVSAQDSIIIMDNDGLISYWNNASEKMFGYTYNDALGKELHRFIVPERYYDSFKEGFNKFRTNGQGPVVGNILELTAIRKDGTEFPVELSVSAVKINKQWTAVGMLRDITGRKQAEDRARQEMEVTKHLLMIAEATAQLTELNKFMATAVHCVQQIMECDISLSYLWDDGDDKTGLFMPCEEAGLNQCLKSYFKADSIKADMPSIKKAMETGLEVIEDITIDDARLNNQGCGLFRLIKDLNRIIVISITGRNGYLGILVCIYVGDGQPARQFTERDKNLVIGIAHQVAIGMENAILYRSSINRALELSRKIETIKVMHEIDKSILSTLNPQEILETVVIMVSRIISCDRVTIVLADYEKKGFYYTAGFGVGSVQKGAFVPFEDTSAAEIIQTRRPQYIANLKDTNGLRTLEKRLLDEGFLSQIRVPLTVKGNCIGVLSIGAKHPAAFTPDDLAILEKLSSQISVALENSRLLQDVEDLFISTVRTLSNTIDAKSPWTNGHSERVTKTAIDIGKKMGFDTSDLRKIEIAGLLHDIGKIGTYETILNKPGRLNEEEQNIVRQHPLKGADILVPIKQLKDIIPAVKHHHEFYDGSGYPDGLKSDQIPLMARILAVADTVDAMGADRPYRKGMSTEEIHAELKRWSGIQFDQKVVEAFLNL